MHCLEMIVKRNEDAVLRAWHEALEDGAFWRCERITVANPDLFTRIGGMAVPR